MDPARSNNVDETSGKTADRISRVLLLAPFIFVAHFLEESPGFVEWFNAHVARGITSGLFWRVNITALIITVVVIGIEWVSPSAFSLGLVVVWLSFLMLANAVFHVAGALVDRQYMPGLVTAVVFYGPFYCWVFTKAVRSGRLTVASLVLAAGFGSLPMLVHGYLIVFQGSRFF